MEQQVANKYSASHNKSNSMCPPLTVMQAFRQLKDQSTDQSTDQTLIFVEKYFFQAY